MKFIFKDYPVAVGIAIFNANKVDWQSHNFVRSDEMRNRSDSYQGPKYFSYNGKTLLEFRLEKEKFNK